jgi:tetratricopeptide (TPR) repeat protein
MEAIAAAASAAGIDRILLFADGMFPPEISQKAFQLCISLIDRSELQNLPAKTPKKTPPPLPVGHHTPAAAATPVVTMPPPVHGPILPTVQAPQVKPKRSFLGQAAILIAALWFGSAGIRVMKRHAAEQSAKQAPVTTPANPTAGVKPASPPTYTETAATRDFRKRHRLDEVRPLDLRALVEDFVKSYDKRIPKVYLDQHRYAISQYFDDLDQHPGLALLIIAEFPDPGKRQPLYEWIIPHLETLGDPVLIYRAKTEKAILSKSSEDGVAAAESFARMLQSLDGTTSYEFHLDDIVGPRGRFIFKHDPETALAALEASPQLPEWIKQLSKGDYHHQLAEAKRGDGSEESISKTKQEPHTSDLVLAESAYTESWKLNPKHPVAATRMIGVSDQLRQSPDEALQWFERALSAQLDYTPAYEAIWNSLLASSEDATAALRQLENICLHPLVAGTEVPLFLLDVHANLGNQQSNPERYWKGLSKEDHRRLLSVLDTPLASVNHPAQRRYYLSLKAALLYLSGESRESSKVCEKLGAELDPSAFAKLPVTADDLVANSYILK